MTKRASVGPRQKTGRKPIPIDTKVVQGMAGVGATDAEIADFVGCTDGTIRKRFSAILTKARSGMRTRLRQAQYRLAIGGNATMLIWLGKQMLGQRDQSQLELSGGVKTSGVLAVPIPITSAQWESAAVAQQEALAAHAKPQGASE